MGEQVHLVYNNSVLCNLQGSSFLHINSASKVFLQTWFLFIYTIILFFSNIYPSLTKNNGVISGFFSNKSLPVLLSGFVYLLALPVYIYALGVSSVFSHMLQCYQHMVVFFIGMSTKQFVCISLNCLLNKDAKNIANASLVTRKL